VVVSRVLGQLHPERPLERGYAIIRDGTGRALTSRAAAAQEAQLVVQFRDGRIDAVPAGRPGAARAPAPRAAPAAKPEPAAQDDLFG